MKKFVIFILFSALFSCAQGTENNNRTNKENYNKGIVILNTLSETISFFNGNKIFNDIAQTDSGSNDLICSDTGETVVINSLSNSLTILDDKLKFKYEIAVDKGSNPFAGTFLNGTVFLTSFLKDSIQIIKTINNRWQYITSITIPVENTNYYLSPMGITTYKNSIYFTMSNLDDNFIPAAKGKIGKIENNSFIESYIMSGKDSVNIITVNDKLIVINAGDYKEGEGFVGNGSVDFFDPVTGNIIKTINIPGAPYSVTGPINGNYFVSNASDNSVFIINYDKSSVVKEIKLSDNPLSFVSDIAIYNNNIYALSFNENIMYKLSPEGVMLKRFVTGNGPIRIKPKCQKEEK